MCCCCLRKSCYLRHSNKSNGIGFNFLLLFLIQISCNIVFYSLSQLCVMRGCVEPCAVSSLCWLSERQSLAVGFSSGAIHIYDCGPEQFSHYASYEQSKRDLLRSGYSQSAVESEDSPDGMVAPRCELAGHRSSVLCLAYDQSQMRLASGGLDTFIVLWDLVAECGIVRLSGHRGAVTRLRFLPASLLEDGDHDSSSANNVLISSSKDSFVKCWDLDTNHCFHTFVSADKRSEVRIPFCIIELN